MTPAVAVVVPVRDGGADLVRCLDALAAQTVPAQVVVADNGSRDGSADVARSHPAVDAVVVEPRRGSYAARNAGVAATGAPVVAFTDADCVPSPDWLARGLAAAAGSPLVGGAIRVTVPADPTSWSVWDAAHYLDQERFVALGFAATANLFVRREVLEAVGGFDPALLSSGDLDLCRRAGRAGYGIAYAADAVVVHPARTAAGPFWRLHRRLGAGWRVLAARGEHPRAWRDGFMRPSYRQVVAAATERGLPVRPVPLAAVHAVAVAGRWAGRATGR